MRKQKPMAGRRGERAVKYRDRLRRWEASQYLWDVHGIKCAPSSLAKYACAGTGPPFQYFNDWIPIYTPAGLDRWVESYFGNLSRTRTQTRNPSRRNRIRLIERLEQEPPSSLSAPTRKARPHPYDNRTRKEPIASDADARGECT